VFLRSVGRISNNSKASCCIWMFSYQWLWRLLPCGMWNHVSVFIVEVSETLKIEAVHYSETLEYIYQITRFQSPQPRILNVNLLFYLIKMTNKMHLCRTIYYSIVPWLLYMFRAILSLIIWSILTVITASGFTHVCRCRLLSWLSAPDDER